MSIASARGRRVWEQRNVGVKEASVSEERDGDGGVTGKLTKLRFLGLDECVASRNWRDRDVPVEWKS